MGDAIFMAKPASFKPNTKGNPVPAGFRTAPHLKGANDCPTFTAAPLCVDESPSLQDVPQRESKATASRCSEHLSAARSRLLRPAAMRAFCQAASSVGTSLPSSTFPAFMEQSVSGARKLDNSWL